MPNWSELLYKEKEQLSRTEYQDSLSFIHKLYPKEILGTCPWMESDTHHLQQPGVCQHRNRLLCLIPRHQNRRSAQKNGAAWLEGGISTELWLCRFSCNVHQSTQGDQL